jgi:hypothetical protein
MILSKCGGQKTILVGKNFLKHGGIVRTLVPGRQCETKSSVPWFDCNESLTWRGLNSNSGHFSCFTFIFVLFGESCLIVSWCAGGKCGMACSDEDHDRSRRPSVENQGWLHRSGTRWPDDREVGWRRVRFALCTWRRGTRVSWLSLKTKVDGLSVVWPQNHWDGFLQFGLKTDGDGFLRFGLKTGGIDFSRFGLKNGDDGFSRFGPKIDGSGFPVWASKPVATVL